MPHRSGVLSMAREDDDLNSAETSFSILLGPAPHLDGKYTIFGQVEWGMPLLGMLASEPRDAKNAPLQPLVVESALVKTDAEIAEHDPGGRAATGHPAARRRATARGAGGADRPARVAAVDHRHRRRSSS